MNKKNIKETIVRIINILGGHHQIIGKFKPLKCGECKIHFAYYKIWKKEPIPIDEITYFIKVE